MSYFIFNRTTGFFVTKTEDTLLLKCYPSSDYRVICSVAGY